MLIPFIKMHAQGNDFVILDAFFFPLPELDYPTLARRICRLHTGIGADGLVIISPCTEADARMVIYNADGSRAEMCGSALRCISELMHKKLQTDKLTVLTDSGVKSVNISSQDALIAVNLGVPHMLRKNYPALGFVGDLIDVGNLHYVVWKDELADNPHLLYGSALELYSGFPRPVNAHFAKVISPHEIEIKIWEHACGATLACGTGAASCVFSGVNNGILLSPVKVNMPGGSVEIILDQAAYVLSGEVTIAFSGEYHWKA
ncbi:MAG: diaminopimelate epimerase [Candidatus Cloacimonetes bacterium HGW-Cloacimonetes-3]|jgi:diaminopimelate epimerase|nr:MAG: diaminopimelate epimerase [Candidatus Cloacimonetes bacterium HGW-Cloacimonetes-3]PKN98395.1 MAG: diaminopimelate epimerase [Chloroflexi bacterium HGW-Chloroflexi-5]